MNTIDLPPLDELLPWITKDIVQSGVSDDWIDMVVFNSLKSWIIRHDANSTKYLDNLTRDRNADLKFRHERAILNNQHLESWMELRGLTEKSLNQLISINKLFKEWLLHFFKDNTDQILLENQDLYSRFVYSIIRVKDYDLCLELYMRITSEEDMFPNVANKYCQSRNSSRYGIVGPVFGRSVHPSILRMLLGAKKGEIKGPFYMDNLWMLLKLESKEDPGKNPEIIETMILDYGAKWLQNQAKVLISSYLRRF